MEDQPSQGGVRDVLQVKQDAISKVKNRFYEQVLRRIGSLILDEISEYLGVGDIKGAQIKILNLPQFLKAFLSFFGDKQLLVESSLLYVSDSLGLMTDEMQAAYDRNLAKIESKKGALQEMKDLLWVTARLGDSFPCQFTLSPYLKPIFPYLEGEIQALITFGTLKILEWLGALNSCGQSLIPIYEHYFNSVLQSINSRRY